MAIGILILHAAATWFMVGVIWFVQVVHYPLQACVGGDAFGAFQRRHMSRTTWVVALPMLTELITAIALIWVRPAAIPVWAVWCGLSGVAVVWASTVVLQMPEQERLCDGFDPDTHRRLLAGNWVRTIVWSARGALVAWMLWQVFAEAR